MRRLTDEEILLGDRVLIVRGRYYPHQRETRTDPPEPAVFEIDSIRENDKDVTEEFTDRFEEVENVVLCQIEDE